MDSSVNSADVIKALDLSHIRFQLIRLEDTITFHLIERVQFPLNKTIYIPGAIHIPNSNLSFFDWYFSEQEKLQSLIRRYESPDEYPFFPETIQRSILKVSNYPKVLHANTVNVNAKIKIFYIEKFLSTVCRASGREDHDDAEENYGSTATCDFACLQALSRRIHFGKFVAESKFRTDPEKYTRLIRASDREGIAASITNRTVEQTVLERVRLKALTYGTDPGAIGNTGKPTRIDVDAIVSMYRDFIIPLTKEVEVEYLMQRLDSTNS